MSWATFTIVPDDAKTIDTASLTDPTVGAFDDSRMLPVKQQGMRELVEDELLAMKPEMMAEYGGVEAFLTACLSNDQLDGRVRRAGCWAFFLGYYREQKMGKQDVLYLDQMNAEKMLKKVIKGLVGYAPFVLGEQRTGSRRRVVARPTSGATNWGI